MRKNYAHIESDASARLTVLNTDAAAIGKEIRSLDAAVKSLGDHDAMSLLKDELATLKAEALALAKHITAGQVANLSSQGLRIDRCARQVAWRPPGRVSVMALHSSIPPCFGILDFAIRSIATTRRSLACHSHSGRLPASRKRKPMSV